MRELKPWRPQRMVLPPHEFIGVVRALVHENNTAELKKALEGCKEMESTLERICSQEQG